MSGTFRKTFTEYADRNLSPEALSQRLAEMARQGVRELVATGRMAPSYRTFVDGVQGASESTVRPGGVILYQAGRLGEAAEFALQVLRDRSPEGVETHEHGHYRNSFYVGVDGNMIPMHRFKPEMADGATEVVIGNRQPYSRKVDVQMVGGRRLNFSTTPGLFDDAAQAVRRRYAELAAKRVYTMRFTEQYMLRERGGGEGGKGARKARAVESPALVITRSRNAA